MSNESVTKKKVQAYPFAGSLENGGAKIPFEILRLELSGFLARLAKDLLKVGDRYVCNFEIPVSHYFVTAEVRVFKTYDRAVNPKEHVIERIAEIHFEGLGREHRSAISAFLKAIGQR